MIYKSHSVRSTYQLQGIVNAIHSNLKARAMSILASGEKSVITLIDRAINQINEDVYDISHTIDIVKVWTDGLSPSEIKDKVNRLESDREVRRNLIAKLNLERYRAMKLESRRLECLRVMNESRESIKLSDAWASSIKDDWLRLHHRASISNSHPISKVHISFIRVYEGVNEALEGKRVNLNGMVNSFEDELERALMGEFKCPSPKNCRQKYYDINTRMLRVLGSLDNYREAYDTYQKILIQERKAYARISKECKI